MSDRAVVGRLSLNRPLSPSLGRELQAMLDEMAQAGDLERVFTLRYDESAGVDTLVVGARVVIDAETLSEQLEDALRVVESVDPRLAVAGRLKVVDEAVVFEVGEGRVNMRTARQRVAADRAFSALALL